MLGSFFLILSWCLNLWIDVRKIDIPIMILWTLNTGLALAAAYNFIF